MRRASQPGTPQKALAGFDSQGLSDRKVA
ncbi:protein of unknown function [Paraburkholderia dioscoreae]|uniref:Uncharacterized protein n=1 Tax=Paraburkholderia dioscoreae TaxID=2604047 RepID=A0A5Q4Z3T4_9BURK|nr:protein of unknown function [Paraburkholderia dioscoreae]